MTKKLLIGGSVLALALSAGGTVRAVTRTVTIYIRGMTCEACAIAIEQELKNTEGVAEVQVSYERGEAHVKYDDQKVTAARLREVINGAGYLATAKPSKRKGRAQRPKSNTCCNVLSCETKPPG